MSLKTFASYNEIVQTLKEKIRLSRIKTVLNINIQLLAIYWDIGNTIATNERNEGWGAKVVERLARDLKVEFPDFKGLSVRNLRYMRNFSIAWPELSILQQPAATIDSPEILQQPVAKLPWGHNCLLLDKLKSKKERLFYAAKSVENNWSRSILLNQIESKLIKRLGNIQNNFSSTLALPQSELARDLFKDPYKFDFLQLSENAKERDVENALVTHLSNFLLEMGRGFAYVGRQYHFEQGGVDYFVDLVLYHLKIHCYVIIELKIGEFKPEYAGKINFYLSLIDENLKTNEDKPSIGIILCKSKNKTTVEYSLRDLTKPIGVAQYEYTTAIPEELKAELPSIEELKNELDKKMEIFE